MYSYVHLCTFMHFNVFLCSLHVPLFVLYVSTICFPCPCYMCSLHRCHVPEICVPLSCYMCSLFLLQVSTICVPCSCYKCPLHVSPVPATSFRATTVNMQCSPHIKLYMAVNAVQWVVVCSAVLGSAVLCSAVLGSAM